MNNSEGQIRIATILGSVRDSSMTGRALRLVNEELRDNDRVALDFIDPDNLSLPMPGRSIPNSDAERLQETVGAATGVVIATPEYHGSYSSVIKLVIDNLGFPSVLGGKPIALLGVAAGAIGAIKALEHLRSVCSHVGGIVLPGPVSVAGVNRVFDEDGHCTDPAIEKRIRGVATRLVDYIEGAICPRIALEELVRSQSS